MLEEFNSWWCANTLEKAEFGIEPYSITEAMTTWCYIKGIPITDLRDEFMRVMGEII